MSRPKMTAATVLACVAAAPGTRPAPATQPAPPSVRVRVARVEDHRFGRLLPDSLAQSNWTAGVKLSLQIAGLAGLTTATGFGHWAVDAADDRGTDVSPKTLPTAADEGSTAGVQADQLTNLDQDDIDVLKPGPDGFAEQTFPVQLGEPTRGAAALRRVTGHVDLTLGGSDHVARFDRPASRFGQTFADADMRSAGVSVTLDPPDPSDRKPGRSSVTFHFHGDPALIPDDILDIVDRGGKTVVDSSGYIGTDPPPHPRTYDLARPLDDTMTVTVRVRLGQRTVRVPFDLHNVPLP